MATFNPLGSGIKAVSGLLLALGGGAAVQAATLVEAGCDSYTWADGPIGGGGSVSLTCPGAGGILASGGAFSNGMDQATHTHRAIYMTNVGQSRTFTQTITSSPPWSADGFYLLAMVEGFASFQGNPGDVFTYLVEVTATYAGATEVARVSGTLDHTGNRSVFDRQGDNCFQCGTGGPFVSQMVTTISGPGEMHLSHTGIGEVGPVPEPNQLALWSVGLVACGIMARRTPRRPGLA